MEGFYWTRGKERGLLQGLCCNSQLSLTIVLFLEYTVLRNHTPRRGSRLHSKRMTDLEVLETTGARVFAQFKPGSKGTMAIERDKRKPSRRKLPKLNRIELLASFRQS